MTRTKQTKRPKGRGKPMLPPKLHWKEQKQVPFDVVLDVPNFPLLKNPEDIDNLSFSEALMKRIQELTPSQEDQTLLTDFVNKIQTILYGLIVDPGSFDACQIDEVREVGAYKKGTMITGDNVADVVIVLKTMPTKESVDLLGKKILNTMIEKNLQDGLKMLCNDRGFDLTTPKATVAIHISTIGPNVKNIDPEIHVNRKCMSSAFFMLRQSRWFEENGLDSTIKMLIKLLTDLRQRIRGFEPLTPWTLDLLAHYCVLNTKNQEPLTLDLAYKRFFKILSAGFFLPSSAGIKDPLTNYGGGIHMGSMSLEEQEKVCMTAQNLLRVLYHGGFEHVIGIAKNSDIAYIAIEKSVWNGVVVFPHQKVYTKPEKKVEEKVEKNEKKDEDTEMTVVKSET